MKKTGFTLIELIISIALVGIILASMIGTLISLKDTYGVINEDVEARTYSALVSKVINEHLMKNNGIKSYTCSDTVCSIKLGNNKEMILKIIISDVKTSDIEDTSTGDKIGTLTEQVTTVKYYEENGGYSYYKTIKHYYKNYNNNDEDIEYGYKFKKLSSIEHAYDSKKTPGLQDYIVNITIEMNNPKYNIELYATSIVDEDDKHHKYRLYTLTYNSNGGKSCIPESQTVRDSQPWGELCIPQRDGYGFKGWYIQPSGSNLTEVTRETIAIEDITIYAHWDKSKYSCEAGTYLAAGHTTCSDCISDYYCPGITDVSYDKFNDQGITPCLTGYHSEPRSTTVTACKITCDENTYLKIANDSSCTSCAVGFQKGSHEVVQGGTSTCEANTPSKPTISGGGTKIYGSSDFTLTCSTPSTYASETNVYYQFGYTSSSSETISNWSTASTTNTYTVSKTAYVGINYYGCRVYVGAGNTSSAVESDKTLVRINNATVTFDATTNGGNLDGTTPLYTKTGVSVLYTGIINTKTTSIPKANKTGYKFDGWYTNEGSKVYNSTPTLQASVSGYTNSNSKWIITEDKTLYGQYSANQYTVTFDCNGGSGAPSSQSATYGESYTLTSNKCSTAKTGYKQNGWNEKADGSGTNWTISNRTNWIWNYTDNVKLYAKWAVKSYTLTADAGEYGTIPAISGWTLGDGNKKATKNVNYNTEYGTLPTPTRANYIFDGWYTSASGGTQVTSSTKMGTSDKTIYAHWVVDNRTITLDDNLFVAKSKTQSGVTITYDSNNQYVTLNGTTTDNSLSFGRVNNVTFTSGTKYKILVTYISGSFSTTATNNLFVMDFQKNEQNYNPRTYGTNYRSVAIPTSGTASGEITYTLSDANGLYFWFWHTKSETTTFTNYKIRVSITPVKTVTATYGSVMPSITVPVKYGFEFGGYYTGYNGTGTQYYTETGQSARNWNLTSDTTLYAKWTLNTINVTFNCVDGSSSTTNTYIYGEDSGLNSSGNTIEKKFIHSCSRSGYIGSKWVAPNNTNKWDWTSSVSDSWIIDVYNNQFGNTNHNITLVPEWSVNTYKLVKYTDNFMKLYDLTDYDSRGAIITKNAYNNYTIHKGTNNYAGATFAQFFVTGKKYHIEYTSTKVSGEMKTIGGHMEGTKITLVKLNGVDRTSDFKDNYVLNTTENVNNVIIEFTYTSNSSSNYLYLQPNRNKNIDVTVNITNLKVYEIVDEGTDKTYDTNYTFANIETSLNDKYGIIDWYNNDSLNTKLSATTAFTRNSATFDSISTPNSSAYIYGKIVKKENVTVYCSLTADKSGVKWKDKIGTGTITTSPNTPSSWTDNSPVTLSANTFYGHAKDDSGNTFTCSLTITEPVLTGKYCSVTVSAEEYEYYNEDTYRCNHGSFEELGTEVSLDSPYGVCTTCGINEYYICRMGDYYGQVTFYCPYEDDEPYTRSSLNSIPSPTCYDYLPITATSCRQGYYNLREIYNCASGTTKIKETNYCIQ